MIRLIVLCIIEIIAVSIMGQVIGYFAVPLDFDDSYTALYALMGLYFALIVLIFNTWAIFRQIKHMAEIP